MGKIKIINIIFRLDDYSTVSNAASFLSIWDEGIL